MSEEKTLGDLGYITSPTGESYLGAGLENGVDPPKKFYGKYRGMVVQNIDPQRRGRLQVQVSAVFGPSISSWAMPCLPFAGFQMGMYVVPPPNAGVWVEFENGNPDKPIWTGFFWGSPAETPAGAQPTSPAMPVFVLETPVTKSGITVSDTPVPPLVPQGPSLPQGGVLLKSGPSYIAISPLEIKIEGVMVTINGKTVTNINNGALVVTGGP